MTRIDLDFPPDEARPYVELYERTVKERDGWCREAEALRVRQAELVAENEGLLGTGAELLRQIGDVGTTLLSLGIGRDPNETTVDQACSALRRLTTERDAASAEVGKLKAEVRTLRNVSVERDDECERMRPVYKAAVEWSRFGRDDSDDENELLRAVRRAERERNGGE